MAELYCRHLLICRTLWRDAANPDDGYSLGRLLVNVRPPEGSDGPFVERRLFAFVQLYGDIGEYNVWIMLGLVELDEFGDEQLTSVWLAGPWLTPVTGLDFVECHAYDLIKVPFSSTGMYEFRLWADGFDEPLASERVFVPDVIKELP